MSAATNLLTQQVVIDFWDAMMKHNDASYVTKGDSSLMKIIAEFLKQMGIMDTDTFMNRYATTIGSVIYVPFEPGSHNRNFVRQITLCVHETKHVLQHKKHRTRFVTGYLMDSAYRARMELEAMICDMNMEYLITGSIERDNATRAGMLSNYACSADDIRFVEMGLTVAEKSITRGAMLDPLAGSAWRMLRDILHTSVNK